MHAIRRHVLLSRIYIYIRIEPMKTVDMTFRKYRSPYAQVQKCDVITLNPTVVLSDKSVSRLLSKNPGSIRPAKKKKKKNKRNQNILLRIRKRNLQTCFTPNQPTTLFPLQILKRYTEYNMRQVDHVLLCHNSYSFRIQAGS